MYVFQIDEFPNDVDFWRDAFNDEAVIVYSVPRNQTKGRDLTIVWGIFRLKDGNTASFKFNLVEGSQPSHYMLSPKGGSFVEVFEGQGNFESGRTPLFKIPITVETLKKRGFSKERLSYEFGCEASTMHAWPYFKRGGHGNMNTNFAEMSWRLFTEKFLQSQNDEQ